MSKKLLITVSLLGTALVAFLFLRSCDKKIDNNTSSTTLAPNVVEKLIVNPITHKLTVITHGNEETLFLPDRPSSIELSTKGTLNVASKQWGTELKPFGGVGYGERWRIYGGADLGYWKRLDGGLFISGNAAGSIRLGGCASYTILSNTRLTLGVDNAKNVNLFVSVRL